MQVILLERVPKLGDMGEEVRVKDGFARNFLLPQGKALRANRDNRAKFEAQKADLETRNAERREAADALAKRVTGKSFIAIRQAGQTGQLYGSVSTRDVADVLSNEGFKVERRQVDLGAPIKAIGLHEITLVLHPEVIVPVTINVARSQDEALRQAKGEDVLAERDDDDDLEFDDDDETPAADAPAEVPGLGDQPDI
ncbi:50S ribosomal protein L9 [Acuticoccus sp. I52.16.1]|uniref:50S ribosomal protein L9 n=1 Tax=Acuticoccus sp. I52.16.1 TaxID=2928472 RepID=UPI001FD1AE2D|nr:50S ribosomal protein L9 [Acuticoccus sp. I52.16.1]UOM33876.1 50S ribosomal protein L9 [Acuticoccus sp. I52.16.1]